MMIGRGHIHTERLNQLTVSRVRRTEWAGTRQNVRQNADAGWRQMEHDENRYRQVRRDTRHKSAQTVDAAGGGADHYDALNSFGDDANPGKR
jgi:hypothetical protein